MTNEERDLITGLFNRLKTADNPQKDRDAEGLIQQSVSQQPTAPYLLVQTVLVQEHALNNAQQRIQQLEKSLQDARNATPQDKHAEGGVGGFLSGLFGSHSGGSTPANPPATPARTPQQQPPPMPPQAVPPQSQAYAQPAQPLPYPSTTNMAPSAGGSFLKSALGTAAGVAGGAMLFQGISNLLGHNAGPFSGGGLGGGFGQGGGFFGGGGGGFGGGPEVIENREVVNNYYDERGNRGDNTGSGDNNSFLGQDAPVGFRPHDGGSDAGSSDSGLYSTPPTDPVEDTNSGDTAGDSGLYSTPPTDDNTNNSAGDDLYSTPPTDDYADNGSMDNSYDSGNADAGGGDFSGDSNDSSYV